MNKKVDYHITIQKIYTIHVKLRPGKGKVQLMLRLEAIIAKHHKHDILLNSILNSSVSHSTCIQSRVKSNKIF